MALCELCLKVICLLFICVANDFEYLCKRWLNNAEVVKAQILIGLHLSNNLMGSFEKSLL
jgi:hypothetical protein